MSEYTPDPPVTLHDALNRADLDILSAILRLAYEYLEQQGRPMSAAELQAALRGR